MNFVIDLCNLIPHWLKTVNVCKEEITIEVPRDSLSNVITFLKKHVNTQICVLSDLTAVDSLYKKERFVVVYQLLSISFKHRIRVCVMVNEYDTLESVVPLFPGANWLEREVWDMFGIFFTNHPDLRRILTDYGFEGHPLRKDFPLSGYVEVRYSHLKKRVVTEPVSLAQEFRIFDFVSPWEHDFKK